MRGFVLLAVCIGAFTAWAVSQFAEAQAPACRYFKVQAPSLNISKEPRGDSPFIDVLDSGDIVCVTREQKAGNRDWVFVAQKVLKADDRKPIDGWANPRLLQALSPGESVALSKAAPIAAPSPAAPPAAAPSAAAAPAPLTALPPETALKFDEPITFGPFPVNGKSIEELARGVPLFPPFEGLDENVWKKNCAACHVWYRRQLCEQGASYAKNPKSVLRHPHPYGGAYKVALMQWAKSGCQ